MPRPDVLYGLCDDRAGSEAVRDAVPQGHEDQQITSGERKHKIKATAADAATHAVVHGCGRCTRRRRRGQRGANDDAGSSAVPAATAERPYRGQHRTLIRTVLSNMIYRERREAGEADQGKEGKQGGWVGLSRRGVTLSHCLRFL